MTSDVQAALLAFGKRVSKEMASGVGDAHREVLAYLARRPDALLVLLDVFVDQSAKPRANRGLLGALLLMLESAFRDLAARCDRGGSAGAAQVDAIRRRLLQLGRETMDPEMLLVLVDAMAKAKLDPGDELRAMIAEIGDGIADEDGEGEPPALADLGAQLADVVRSVKGDVFALVEQIETATRVLPDQSRAVLVAAIAGVPDAAARESMPGFLADPSPAVRSVAIRVLQQFAAEGAISGVMLRRLASIRAWLPEHERVDVDRVLDVCRDTGVEHAPWPPAQIERSFVSGVDGSGAQTLFAVVREGKKFALVSLLLKRGAGLADAFVEHGLTKGKLNRLLGGMAEELDTWPTTPAYVRAALGDVLATGRAVGTVPPFTMLEAAEAWGLDDLRPEATSVEALVDDLCRAVDGAEPAADIDALIAESAFWYDDFDFVGSWFEEDDVVARVIASVPADDAQSLGWKVLDEIVAPRRRKWAETIAWVAFMLREARDDEPWEPFAVVARELLTDRPAADLPILRSIAALTIEAHFTADEELREPPA